VRTLNSGRPGRHLIYFSQPTFLVAAVDCEDWLSGLKDEKNGEHLCGAGLGKHVQDPLMKILLVISGDKILGASAKGHLVCWTVSLTRYGRARS
jgi:hypothetical protein